MNLTWHIVKKDLRALRWPLLGWTLVIIAKLGVGVAMLTAVGTLNADWFANWFARMDTFSKLLAGLEYMSVVLVAAVVHEDLLVGTTAFWMTRPIAGARLLRAKILTAVLAFLVLPVLVTLPWWLGCGYGLREIAWAALETVLIQTLCVLLGLVCSVVTDGLARFLMWAVVLIFAVPSIASVIGVHLSTLEVKPTTELLLSRVWVAIAIAVLAILLVTVHQFLTRRTWRSIGAICSAIGLMVVTGLWWPWDLRLLARRDAYVAAIMEEATVSGELAEPAGFKFAVEAPRLTARPGAPLERLNNVQINFRVSGVPDTRVLLPQRGRYTLHWADGTTDFGYGWIHSHRDPLRYGSQLMLGSHPRATERDDQQSFTYNMTLPAATLSRAHAEKPSITVRSDFRLLKFESATKFPLQPGARILTESKGERVARVESMDGQILVTYIKSRPDLVVGDKLIHPFPQVATPYSFFGLVNQAAGEFDLGRTQLEHESRIATVEISLQMVAYGNKSTSRKSALVEPWLRDAEISRQTFIEDVQFSRELGALQFPTETANP